ncbi:MAG: LysM peptidoglycan-binding domain-containing protein [Gammaproteobacteria bacterium]|nr:LysM peptidoglycan-binding domain-containing protein [Gammaproteobacteria bacterium]
MKWIIQFLLITLISANAYSLSALNREGIQTYQTDVHLSSLHKQKIAEDLSRFHHADNIWEVLRDEFSLPHYEDNPQVQERIEWFMNNQDYLLRSATRAAPYLYYILHQVKKKHLPAEIVLLPIIESGYNPFSLSSVGAAGLWQLMPGTATGFGVKQSAWYDGRRDIIASTRGALNYLAYLQNFFEGNWLLAIAAYNTGEGNVLSAIKRNIRDGRRTDFWSLPVAQQTRDYVPSLLALAAIISRPDIYPLYFPPVKNAPYLAQIEIGRQINLNYASNLAGLSFKNLMELNPGFSHSTTAKGPYKLVLPIENVEQFSENLARSPLNTQVKWFHYKVKSSDTLATVAKKFNTNMIDVRKLNHLVSNTIYPDTNLLIPNTLSDTKAMVPIMELLANNKKNASRPTHLKQLISPIVTASNTIVSKINLKKINYSLQPGDTVYMIRSNDTLRSVAQRFKIHPDFLLAVNKLKSSDIKTGKQLIIPTHASKTLSQPNANKKITRGDTLYVVRRGDTIAKIAQKFHTSASALRIVNFIDDNSLQEGEKIVVPISLPS